MDNSTLTGKIRVSIAHMVFPPWPEKGLTLGDVAEASGVSKPTLSRFLRGKSVDSDTLDKLATYVGVNHATE